MRFALISERLRLAVVREGGLASGPGLPERSSLLVLLPVGEPHGRGCPWLCGHVPDAPVSVAPQYFQFAITTKEDSQVIGNCGIRFSASNMDAGNIRYKLNLLFRGKAMP